MVTNQKVILMNAKETKAKMDKVVNIRKLLAKLDREIFALRGTLNELQHALDNDSTVSCTIELTDIEVKKECGCC
jgi:hypothetical protein|tara:strand:+ start:24 stop:248 length:225 start_codon:yes stop_codon:yes gene_type:complete